VRLDICRPWIFGNKSKFEKEKYMTMPNINTNILIYFKNIFFYPEYSMAISKSSLKWLELKFVNKFLGLSTPGKETPMSLMIAVIRSFYGV
jgi:hypothetical protein